MKIAFVVGEESADRIGADLIRGLRRQSGETLVAVGLGGEDMRAEGLRSLFDIEELSIIGLGAIVSRLPQLARRLRQTSDFILRESPDAVVTIDSFTFANRVAGRVRKLRPGIPIVNVVPPAVWAYRPGRAAALAAAVDHTICLFPFEPEFFAAHGGPPATYVGHPLMSHPRLREIMLERGSGEKGRSPAAPPRLLILPGSRRGEVLRLMDAFGETLSLLKDREPDLRAVLPAVPRVRKIVEDKLASWRHKPEIVCGDDAKWREFATADAALAASGTVSLELALAGVPMALAYRLDPVSYRLRHLITGWTAALPNFIAGHPLVPEHFHEFVRPEHLARRIGRLVHDTPERRAQVEGFAEIRRRMAVDKAPGDAAADIVLAAIAGRRTTAPS